MPNEIEIFQAGTQTSSNGATLTFNNSDLDAIASSYNPTTFEAPAVVGHPRDNSPAYGWVESVRRVGNKLMAKLTQVDPEFEEAVKTGRYKKISASFYSPDSSANPNPGSYYLRHVGFLGGMAPAVKGLKSVAFSEEEAGVLDFCCGDEDPVLWRNLREWLISEYDLETADRIVPNYVLNLPNKNNSQMEIDFLSRRVQVLEDQLAEFMHPKLQEQLEGIGSRVVRALQYMENESMDEADFSEREAALIERERQITERETALKRGRIMDFVESRMSEGRVLPAERAELIEFMCALPEGHVDFSEDKSQAPLDWFQSWLKSRPKVIEYGEVATEAKNVTNIDPKALAEKATKLVTDRKALGIAMNYSEAVQEVMGGAK